MISNTTGRLFIIHSNAFLQKQCVFPCVRDFTLIFGPYSCLIDGLFGHILMKNFVGFFKCLLNCQAHALQFELKKVGYTNFRLQSRSSNDERAFEEKKYICIGIKRDKLMYILIC